MDEALLANLKTVPEAAAGAALAEKYVVPHEMELEAPEGGDGKVPFLVLPTGLKTHSVKGLLDEWRTRPERRKGSAEFEDLASFIAHVNRFKDEGSALFASADSSRLTSVLDYHPSGADSPPRFGVHRGIYDFPISDEWEAWTTANGSEHAMKQEAFAAFVEEHIMDVADPARAGDQARALAAAAELVYASPSRLLSLSRGLTIRQGLRMTNMTSLQTGEAVMHFESQNADENGAPLVLPSAFLIQIPVFKRGAPYLIAARLRFRFGGGTAVWWYDLYKEDLVFEHAFKEACDEAVAKTELPLFLGTPE